MARVRTAMHPRRTHVMTLARPTRADVDKTRMAGPARTPARRNFQAQAVRTEETVAHRLRVNTTGAEDTRAVTTLATRLSCHMARSADAETGPPPPCRKA